MRILGARQTCAAVAATMALFLALAGWSTQSLRAQAGTVGQWRTLTNQVPINPVHVALMNNGKVRIVAGSDSVATETNFEAAVWDAACETFRRSRSHETCSATEWSRYSNSLLLSDATCC
jgi:hypothetical protein